MPLGTEVNLGASDVDGVADPPEREWTQPTSFRFMSVVAKRLDG